MNKTQRIPNVITRNGAVHVGRKVDGFGVVPACMTMRQVQSMHFAVQTAEGVTCKNCKG